MMALQLDQAAKDMSGAVDEVASRSSGSGVGVVGFCMGGGLALMLASQRPDKVRAVVPFYGVVPWQGRPARLRGALSGAVLGHYAGKDESASPEAARALVRTLREAGNSDVDIHIYPDADHAFFNDTRPEVYDAEASRARLAADARVPRCPSRLSAPVTPRVVERYLALGLALDRHVEGLVDAYYGPQAIADRVAAAPIVAPARLVAEARALLGDHRRRRAARRPAEVLRGRVSAPSAGADAARRHFLRSQTVGLLTSARKLAGETIGLRRRGGGLLRGAPAALRRGRLRGRPPPPRGGRARARPARGALRGLARGAGGAGTSLSRGPSPRLPRT